MSFNEPPEDLLSTTLSAATKDEQTVDNAGNELAGLPDGS